MLRAWYTSVSAVGGPYHMPGTRNPDGTTTYRHVEYTASQWAQWRQRTHFALVG